MGTNLERRYSWNCTLKLKQATRSDLEDVAIDNGVVDPNVDSLHVDRVDMLIDR